MKRFFKQGITLLMTGAIILSGSQITSKKADAAVKITKLKVTNANGGKSVTLRKGKKTKLKVTIKAKPNKAANKKVTFKSSNKKVATVTAKGVVKGIKKGTAKITVTSKKMKKKKAVIKVTVKNPVTTQATASTDNSTVYLYDQYYTTLTNNRRTAYVRYEGYLDYVSNITMSGRLPSGVKSELTLGEEGGVYISGTPTEVVTNRKVIFTATNENGKKAIQTVYFNTSADADKITVITSDIEVPLSQPIDQLAYNGIMGASGSYNYELIGNAYGFYIDNYGYIEGQVSSKSTRTLNIKITDSKDSSITTTAAIKLIPQALAEVSGKVSSLGNNPCPNQDVYAIRTDKASSLYGTQVETDLSGYYIFTGVAGATYNICIVVEDTYKILKTITLGSAASIKKCNITAPLYRITLNYPDGYSSYGNWFISSNYVATGQYMLLPVGEYSLTGFAYKGKSAFLSFYRACATLNFTVTNKDITATPVIHEHEVGSIAVGETVSVPGEDCGTYAYEFVPETTGSYTFYSEGSYDTFGVLYNKDWEYLTTDDSSGTNSNFSVTYTLTAGQTYYLTGKIYQQSFEYARPFTMTLKKN